MYSWCKNTVKVLILVVVTFVWFVIFLMLLDVLRIATRNYYFWNDLDGIPYRLHLLRICMFAIVSMWWFAYYEFARKVVRSCHN
jgi:hypothetical protein